MKSYRTLIRTSLAIAAAAFVFAGSTDAQQIPSPEEFFGHQMGADRKLARWDRLVAYYDTLGALSDRLVVEHVGPSTLGNPFLVIYASSPENLANLAEIKRMNAVLSDPRGHTPAEVDAAVENSKVIFVQSYALHSTEVAASQTAAEVVYLFATRTDDGMEEILDETVSILIPAFNPDGNIIVTDWYNRWVGTEYEGSGPPELYHHYIGHDNNRDAFMQATVESQYGAQIMFREFVPQAFIDHHQMGPYTARIYLPPYAEPIRPEGDPLVWREMTWYGAHMAYKMDEANLSGAIGAAIYSGWGHFGFHWITPFHNIAGMLTESASARLATPLFVHPDQLGGSRQFPEYAEQTTFPNPWLGGWWRVRDIVDRQIVATFSPLELAAKNRETVLRNAYNKAARQTQRGLEGEVKAYVIPAEQHDALTMQKMVNKLLGQGVTLDRATRDFQHEGRVYTSGSYVVSMAQPKRGLIRWLLGQTFYPDNTFTRDTEGDPIRPYDMSSDNLAEFMGVRVDPVASAVETALTRVTSEIDPSGVVTPGSAGYVLSGRLNDSFEAVNRLFAAGARVRRAESDGEGFRMGDFIVAADTDASVIRGIAEETGVDFMALNSDASAATYPLSQQRIAMYQRFYGGNMDEGWTRLLLEDFSFEYTTIMDAEIQRGQLHERWDVIILPADSKRMMTEGGGDFGDDANSVPPDYRSGFGQEGIEALDAFVENGGTLISFAQAGELVLDELGVPVHDAVDGLSGNDFWSPGSTLKIKVDNTNPFAYGMPKDALATFLAGGQVYETIAGSRSSDVQRVATYLDRDILQSGWLLGEEAIASRAAIVAVEKGQGSILMLGFRAQHRAQTHGTFKFFFNALVNRSGSRPAA
ncbi:MAG: M14 family zinc carboxypeptidase [Gemmatimonadetes bacterium]|nr:M14 family zinc carboxypeptidase [Gemmatimonadota bacterium]MDA1103447.1 M14 family zinc carboxypeptidase [Gemmatimonadota bacterium]